MKTLTKLELKLEVSKIYTGYLTHEKSLKLFELEHGYIPKIIEPESEVVNSSVFKKYNLPDYTNEMQELKRIQETSQYNMIVGFRSVIARLFFVDRKTAEEIHNCYLKHYTDLYYPEELV